MSAPEILDKMVDIVLSYRPKAKRKKPRKRKSRAKTKQSAKKPPR
jgi:hypothetical protein